MRAHRFLAFGQAEARLRSQQRLDSIGWDRLCGPAADSNACGDLDEGSFLECTAQVVYDPETNRHIHLGDHRCGSKRWINGHEATQARFLALRIKDLIGGLTNAFDKCAEAASGTSAALDRTADAFKPLAEAMRQGESEQGQPE